MLRQKPLDIREHGEPVLPAGEPVPLVRREQILHRTLEVAQGDDDLFGLRLLHARIVGTLDDEQGRLDLLRMEEGRLRLQARPIRRGVGVAHPAHEHLSDRPPVRGDRLQQRDDVGRSDDRHPGRVELRRERDARQRRVAPVGAAHDRHLFGIGDARVDEMPHAVGDVVLHDARAPLAVTLVEEPLAIAGGTAEVGHHDGVAPVGEELRHRVVAPRVPGPGSAMRHDHRR